MKTAKNSLKIKRPERKTNILNFISDLRLSIFFCISFFLGCKSLSKAQTVFGPGFSV